MVCQSAVGAFRARRYGERRGLMARFIMHAEPRRFARTPFLVCTITQTEREYIHGTATLPAWIEAAESSTCKCQRESATQRNCKGCSLCCDSRIKEIVENPRVIAGTFRELLGG